MYFLAWQLSDIVEMLNNALRGLCGFLCEFLYPFIASLYDIFINLGTQIYVDDFTVIYNKISLIIGIFMVFRVTFWLIESMINPDTMSDKEKNPGKIIQKVLIAVVLLATTPTIFKYAFELQNKIVNSQIIENVMSINTPKDATTTGRFLAAELFGNFYTPATYEENGQLVTVNSDCTEMYTGDGPYSHYISLSEKGKLNDLTNSCLTQRINDDDTAEYEIDFNGLLAVGVGGFVFWMMLMYCISLGTRYVQLVYLQVIAPIPIMCYLAPGKDNMFSKWVKQCTTTYLDLFIRIAIINFVMILSTMILSNNSGLMSSFANDSGLIEVFLVLGLITFAKKAPQLIQELIPTGSTKASGDFGLSWKKRTDNMLGGKYLYNVPKKAVGFAAATAIGAPLRLGVRAYDAAKYNAKEDKKLGRYRQQRINEIMNSNILSDAQKAKITDRINSMSKKDLRKELSNDTKAKIAEYNSLLGNNSESAKKRRAELMEQITENRNSGMGHRNQMATAATSILGATTTAASAAVKGKTSIEIFKNAISSQTKSINKEQEWYKMGGSSAFGDIVKRTISEVQRTFGIETEGQAVQYVIDEYKAEIKAKEEEVKTAQEVEKGYSSSKSSIKAVESEGAGDRDKGKSIVVYDKDNQGNVTARTINYRERVGAMRALHQRVDEAYKTLDDTQGKAKVSTNKNSSHYSLLTSLIESVAINSSHKKSEQDAIRTELTNLLDNSDTFNDAYNSIINRTEGKINKAEGDYGKLQGSGAAILTYLYKQAGAEESFVSTQYNNSTVENEYKAVMREIAANKNRYGQDIVSLAAEISTFVKDGKDLSGYNENTIGDIQKKWSKLKDLVEAGQAEAGLHVSELNDELQETRHEASAFEGYVVTQDKLNNDKYNSGK